MNIVIQAGRRESVGNLHFPPPQPECLYIAFTPYLLGHTPDQPSKQTLNQESVLLKPKKLLQKCATDRTNNSLTKPIKTVVS